MSNIATINPADSQQIDTALSSLRDLLRSPVASQAKRDEVNAIIAALLKRGEPERALVRVVALLRQYFQTDTAQSVIEVEAEDWVAGLQGIPDWAICRACRWWQGPDNPHRRKKPMIGDIVELCRNELALVSMARAKISAFDHGHLPAPADPPRQRVTKERAAEIMLEVFGAHRDIGAVGQPKRIQGAGEQA